ncbi:hypothetical protein R1sor_000356 [Riccia sorocarpa]|uniref:Protein kinase domain-containing protein n=1 Tax=Riccia sorocarpa TaxID=122646 RepID=A0ABD3GVC6_9MARC
MIGKGSYGSVYRIGFRDVALGIELGMEGMVSYVAKKCDALDPNSAWVMMHKELASFVETHCAIVRPIACHNIEAEPLLSALEFMHEHNWLNCDILVKNVFLHFPDWDYDDIQLEKRMPTWEDKQSLVFAALEDLGMAQQVHVAASDKGVKYPRTDPIEREWIALELVDEKIRELAKNGIIISPVNEYNKATDVYALGMLTHKVCGDFFTDMTRPERNAYNDKYYAEGADKNTSPAARNAILLKDLIEYATHNHPGLRNSIAQCFTIMSDMMKINPMTCNRPIETPSQQKRKKKLMCSRIT